MFRENVEDKKSSTILIASIVTTNRCCLCLIVDVMIFFFFETKMLSFSYLLAWVRDVMLSMDLEKHQIHCLALLPNILFKKPTSNFLFLSFIFNALYYNG